MAEYWSWTGPVPSPQAIEHYEHVLPGLGDRLIALTEREAAHRELMEKTTVEAALRSQSRGQILGFIIAMTVIIAGVVLIAIGKKAEGLAAVLVPLAGIVGVFAYSELRNRPRESPPLHETPTELAEPEPESTSDR